VKQFWSTFVYLLINEKDVNVSLQETLTLTISFFKNRDLEWYNRCGEMSIFAKLILGL